MAAGTIEGLKNWLGGEKTARPANVGPHDRQEDQHDPDAPKRRPGEMYSSEVEGQAAIVGPKSEASGKAPVTIKLKGAADNDATGGHADDGDRGSG